MHFTSYGILCLGIPIQPIEDEKKLEELIEGLLPEKYLLINYGEINEHAHYMLILPKYWTTESYYYEKIKGLPKISKQEKRNLLKFCEKYNIIPENEFGWYLIITRGY